MKKDNLGTNRSTKIVDPSAYLFRNLFFQVWLLVCLSEKEKDTILS